MRCSLVGAGARARVRDRHSLSGNWDSLAGNWHWSLTRSSVWTHINNLYGNAENTCELVQKRVALT